MPRLKHSKPLAQKKTWPVRSRRNDVDSAAETVGQDHPRVMKSEGPARQSLDPARIEVVDRPINGDKAAMLAFMEEEITVLVHDSNNPLDDPIPAVWNDGISQYFLRGKEQTVKRKFVEVLARAKRTTFSQKELPNRMGFKQIPHTANKFPFTVVNDANPRGKDWLKGVLSEA